MNIISASNARTRIQELIDEIVSSHTPVLIRGKRNNAVLLSEEDWNAIQETLFLLSIPGMGASIREGLDTPVGDCVTQVEW